MAGSSDSTNSRRSRIPRPTRTSPQAETPTRRQRLVTDNNSNNGGAYPSPRTPDSRVQPSTPRRNGRPTVLGRRPVPGTSHQTVTTRLEMELAGMRLRAEEAEVRAGFAVEEAARAANAHTVDIEQMQGRLEQARRAAEEQGEYVRKLQGQNEKLTDFQQRRAEEARAVALSNFELERMKFLERANVNHQKTLAEAADGMIAKDGKIAQQLTEIKRLAAETRRQATYIESQDAKIEWSIATMEQLRVENEDLKARARRPRPPLHARGGYSPPPRYEAHLQMANVQGVEVPPADATAFSGMTAPAPAPAAAAAATAAPSTVVQVTIAVNPRERKNLPFLRRVHNAVFSKPGFDFAGPPEVMNQIFHEVDEEAERERVAAIQQRALAKQVEQMVKEQQLYAKDNARLEARLMAIEKENTDLRAQDQQRRRDVRELLAGRAETRREQVDGGSGGGGGGHDPSEAVVAPVPRDTGARQRPSGFE